MKRLADGGVPIIRVGVAVAEPRLKEKKARAEDALAATRAAVEEGIIPGGDIALRDSSFTATIIRRAKRRLIGVQSYVFSERFRAVMSAP